MRFAVGRTRAHGGAPVLELPILWKAQPKTEIRMHKRRALEHPLGGVLPEEETVDSR